jgi:hypothetical protein
MANDTKERLFEAWREWDCELEDLDKKQAAKERLDQLTDRYRDDNKKGGSRTLTRFYLRKEYAKWRLEND